MNEQASKREPGRFLLKIFISLLLCPIILLWVAIVLLYVPAVQDFAVNEVCRAINKESKFNIAIGGVHLAFPLKITIDDFSLSQNDSVVVAGEQLSLNVRPFPLIKGEIEINYVSIENTQVHTGDMIEGVGIDGSIGHFRSVARNIDLSAEEADIRQLHISDTEIGITLLQTQDDEKEDSTSTPFNWVFGLRKGSIKNLSLNLSMPQDTTTISARIGELSLRNAVANIGEGSYGVKSMEMNQSRLRYDKGTQSDSVAPLDHINIEEFAIATDEVTYSPQQIAVNINSFVLHQKNGIRIEEGRIVAHADTNNINIKSLLLRSEKGTYITGKSTISQSAIEGEKGGEIKGDITIEIDKRDLIGLIPSQTYSHLDILPDSMLRADMHVSGNLGALHLDTLNAVIPHIASLGSKGAMRNIMQKEKREGELLLNGYIPDVCHFIYSGSKPDSVVSRALHLQGSLSMSGEEYNAHIHIASNDTRANVTASYDTGKESYSANAVINKLQTADILPHIPLNRLDMHAEATGTGINIFDSLTTYSCHIAIDSVVYNNILLNAIELNAEQADALSDITIESNDPHLQLHVQAKTRIDSTALSNSTGVTLKNADFEYLGITRAPLDMSMQVDIAASTDMQKRHRLKVTGDKFKLVTQKRTFTPARLEFEGATSPDTTFANLNTGDLKANAFLSTGYEELFAALDRISQMYNEGRTSEKTLYYVQDFEKELPAVGLSIDCGNKNILANYLLFNNIKFKDFGIRCNIDSIKGINARADLHALEKDGFTLDTIRFFVRQDSSMIRYFAGIRSTTLDPQRQKLRFSAALFGNLENDNLKTNFVFRDGKESIGARIGLNTLLKPEGLNFHFVPEATFMNRPFRFNSDNYLNIEKSLAIDGDIELTDSTGSGMHIYTTPDSLQIRNINAKLFNIDLQALTSLLPFAPDISGILNADIHYSDGERGVFASGDIRGTDIAYEGMAIGDETIEIAYLPQSDNTHYIDLTLYHNNNEILTLNGDFHDNEEAAKIDGSMELLQFPLKLSNAFIRESGMHIDGYIDGRLSVNGPLDNTEANGYIGFDSVYVDAPMFGTRLHLVDDKVAITDNKLTFKNFDIYAKGSTPFNINGTVDLNHLTNPAFNLRMQARNYELINATRKKGNMLYGRLFLDANAFIGGTLNAMKLYGSATVLGKSDITYVMQNSPLATDNELDGLVEFVNFADTTKTVTKEEETADFGNMTINMNLQIEEGARINADFDENRNSYIELQGEGGLSLTYTDESKMNLTGRYTLSNGQLKYTLPVIPLKTFSISDGSYINWTGDIADPTLHITALERVMASVTMEDGNTQAVAFDVGVILTNTLSDMGLSFTLSAPENATVQNELNSIDKETMNKYAVTMLITGAYLGSNGGITVSNAISSFLDSKINDLAGNAMKSVSINVGITDVENAETGDTYKNYSFSFSKRFWNDRLTVIIGGEVNSGKNANQNNNESFINNVSLEWKISESGNRYIRLFYDKNYESILEGEIIETGVGYVYKRKLNNLKELLIFRRKDNDATIRNDETKENKE